MCMTVEFKVLRITLRGASPGAEHRYSLQGINANYN